MRLHSKSGFSIVETMVVSVLMIIGAYAMMRYTRMSNLAMMSSRTMASRDQSFNELASLLEDPKIMKASVDDAVTGTTGNLKGCFTASDGVQCTNNATNGFYLRRSGTSVAGPDATPVRYSKTGAICTGPPSIECPFEAVATYTPSCASGGTCDYAHNAQLILTFRQSASVTSLDPNSPVKYATRTHTYNMQYNQLNGLSARSCNPGYYVTGINADGSLACQQAARSCTTSGQYVKGINANGTLDCATPTGGTPSEPPIICNTSVVAAKTATCPSGKFMSQCWGYLSPSGTQVYHGTVGLCGPNCCELPSVGSNARLSYVCCKYE